MDRIRYFYWLVPLAALGGLTLAAVASAQAPAAADSGWAVYFQYCAGCHDRAELSADKTVPVLRELGEPRVRRALEDTPGATHGDLGKKITPPRLAMLVGYLSPDADPSFDCGPPELKMTTASPECRALKGLPDTPDAPDPPPPGYR